MKLDLAETLQVFRDLAHLQNHHSETIDVIVCTARMLHKFRFGNTLAHQVMYEIDMNLMLDDAEGVLRNVAR